ncbi:hypothetical protein E9549_04945 [Blastococcus sp. MG754426]|uniref:hypothetical protein n=1 Tax=unclassified Blastococcus TaxID=2619396 RepID=UPI001EF0D5D3|nr:MULTISPECIES: hypothetical protein [unclassified Blastococcus]MCF6506754.1 hypothetical protein [Blastococcus sp. MG754426]MCF6511325.1 hypothetical protein [Blastococcus sp. MG754427]MCF6734780.1 hypothetical protein [Blastococcus sp. KM273129]
MRIQRLATAGAAVLLLAGCGGSEDAGTAAPATTTAAESASSLADQDAAEVVDTAFGALEEAGAAHVVGSMEEGGTTQELDLQLQGEDAQGTITMDGATVELVYTAGTAYVRAPADFWASFGMPAEFAGQLEGQWVLMPEEAAGSFSTLTLSGLVQELRASGGSDITGEVTSGELDGEPVVVVTQDDGSTLTVADDEDAPYPLLIEDKGDAPATVRFSEFGETVEITAPENPVDLNTLGG